MVAAIKFLSKRTLRVEESEHRSTMYKQNLISVPRTADPVSGRASIEWEIPGQVSVAFALIDKFGYTVMARVRVNKKHWWNRSWKTFATHATNPSEAVSKGQELLERYGYKLEYDIDELERVVGNPDRL